MSRQHILVVDDIEAMLSAIKSHLVSEGYIVHIASDGIEALKVMEEVTPDLILADIMMPRMDGYTFYEKVRQKPEWVPIPFIFLTAKSEPSDVLKGKALGVEDYITKPFDADELIVAVRSRLKRANAIQDAADAAFAELKSQIVTILGHELRTPLTYVTGYTELAMSDVSSLSPEQMEEFLLGIKRGADRLNQLVEDLMLLVQIDTGQAAKDFRMMVTNHTDLEEVIERTVRQNKDMANQHGVTLETAIESPLPPVRLCEPFFVDALTRLIDNGIKFSNGEANEEKRVVIEARTESEQVKVAVSDNGIGIPPDGLDKIFERFRQIDRERLEQQGVGLGLPIARALIRLHDGTVAVESALGEGSTFTISLPEA